MLYKISRSVPKNTIATAPDWQKLQVSKGTITEWIFFFPDEAADLCQFKVEYHHNQILPVSGKEWIYGIFKAVNPKENILLDAAPYVLDVYAVNTDDNYSHEYNLYVNVVPEKAFKPPKPDNSLKDKWNKIFGSGG